MIWNTYLQRRLVAEMRPGRRYTARTLADIVGADVDAVYGSLCRLAEEGVVERVRDRQAVAGVSWRVVKDDW